VVADQYGVLAVHVKGKLFAEITDGHGLGHLYSPWIPLVYTEVATRVKCTLGSLGEGVRGEVVAECIDVTD
jgi:hypothetical protein